MNQPYSCEQWGNVADSGIPLITDDTGLPMFGLFHTDNLLPSVVPSEAHSYSVLDYNFIWIELLDFYFFQTKDKDFIYGKTNIIKGLIENFKKYTDKDGLLISKPGKRLFLDWSLVSRNEPNAIYNLHYLYFLQKSAVLLSCQTIAL